MIFMTTRQFPREQDVLTFREDQAWQLTSLLNLTPLPIFPRIARETFDGQRQNQVPSANVSWKPFCKTEKSCEKSPTSEYVADKNRI